MDEARMPTVRSEFRSDVPWGSISDRLRRYEFVPPAQAGPVLGLSETVGAVHVERCSLMLRIGGGHLRAPRDELLVRVQADARERLKRGSLGPVEHIERVIEWLEGEQRSGILEHSYTTATLVAVVSDAETWTWHVGPHGVACGRRTGVRFRSTDLRYPVLQKLGVMKPSGFQSAGTGPRDQASSIYCIGTPTGYERLRMHLEPDDVAVAFEVGSFPFGPLPSDPVPLHALWAMDAAWRHGLQGVGVTVGFLGTEDLELPESWQVREELLSLA